LNVGRGEEAVGRAGLEPAALCLEGPIVRHSVREERGNLQLTDDLVGADGAGKVVKDGSPEWLGRDHPQLHIRLAPGLRC
jgi:hypothetical protein